MRAKDPTRPRGLLMRKKWLWVLFVSSLPIVAVSILLGLPPLAAMGCVAIYWALWFRYRPLRTSNDELSLGTGQALFGGLAAGFFGVQVLQPLSRRLISPDNIGPEYGLAHAFMGCLAVLGIVLFVDELRARRHEPPASSPTPPGAGSPQARPLSPQGHDTSPAPPTPSGRRVARRRTEAAKVRGRR